MPSAARDRTARATFVTFVAWRLTVVLSTWSRTFQVPSAQMTNLFILLAWCSLPFQGALRQLSYRTNLLFVKCIPSHHRRANRDVRNRAYECSGPSIA